MFKKLFYSALTCTFIFNVNLPSYSTEKEVRVYSGRHYNTDRNVFKKFAQDTGCLLYTSPSPRDPH